MKESNVFPGSWEMCCTSYLSQCSVPENSGTLYCRSYLFAELIHFALLPHLSGTSSGILWKGGSIFGDWTHWLGFRICAIGSLVMFMRDRSDSGGVVWLWMTDSQTWGVGWEGEAFLTQEQQRSVNEDPKKQTVDQYHMHNMDLNARALFQNMLW